MPDSDTLTRPPATSSPIFVDQEELNFTFAVPLTPAIHTFMDSTQATSNGKSYLKCNTFNTTYEQTYLSDSSV